MVTGKFQAKAGVAADEMPFVADPPPANGEVIPWAVRQFEALQRALGGGQNAALEARVKALEDIVGDGTWDGGSP